MIVEQRSSRESLYLDLLGAKRLVHCLKVQEKAIAAVSGKKHPRSAPISAARALDEAEKELEAFARVRVVMNEQVIHDNNSYLDDMVPNRLDLIKKALTGGWNDDGGPWGPFEAERAKVAQELARANAAEASASTKWHEATETLRESEKVEEEAWEALKKQCEEAGDFLRLNMPSGVSLQSLALVASRLMVNQVRHRRHLQEVPWAEQYPKLVEWLLGLLQKHNKLYMVGKELLKERLEGIAELIDNGRMPAWGRLSFANALISLAELRFHADQPTDDVVTVSERFDVRPRVELRLRRLQVEEALRLARKLGFIG
jgi:hypothetical protein